MVRFPTNLGGKLDFAGALAELLLEAHTEILRVREADHIGHFCNGVLLRAQQFHRLIESHDLDEVIGTLTRQGFQFVEHSRTAHRQILTELGIDAHVVQNTELTNDFLVRSTFGKQSAGRPVTSLVPTNYTDLSRGVIGATSSCLGGDADLMMGIALAQKMKKTGKIVAFVTGDGTLGKGNYHETFTMASLFKLPIIFVIRSNGWAMSTPVEGSVAFRHVSDMAAAYQIHDDICDGNDALAVCETVERAAEYCRAGNGPVIIEAKTYRMSPHSSHDEDDYRPAYIRTHWRAKDPVTVMGNILKEFGVAEEEINAIKEDTQKRVADAFAACEGYPAFDVSQVLAKEKATVDHMWGRE